MSDQISVEADILVKLVRELQVQLNSDESHKVNPETLTNAIKICDRLQSLLYEGRNQKSPELSE